jgi:hypothetical protein
MEPQTTLRDALEASFDKVEVDNTENISEVKQDERIRDDSGKFASEKVEAKPEEKLETKPEVNQEVQEEKPALMRPTTWKKEYLPIWDKLSKGEQLSLEESAKLAAYSNQRENEYKTGVSTYKAEAQQAKMLQDAIAPFVPDLQAQNIAPQQFIQNLGNAHMMLVKGSPEQKIRLFAKLAQDYGVPLNMVANQQQGGQPNQEMLQLMQELQAIKSQVSGVTGWKEQLESQQVQQQISEYSDASKYPYFEMVRGNMAQLLESGKAQTLKEAYEIASEPLETMINQRLEQVKVVQPTQANQNAVKQAKAKAVSTKSSTPSGVVSTNSAKDRRSLLSDAVDNLMGGARV